MSDLIERQVVENAICNACGKIDCDQMDTCEMLKLPSAQPERLTDDDFETIRIHLNAYKEKLCNQQRWEEADEYQRIIDRFMAFASAQPEIIRCKDCKYYTPVTAHCEIRGKGLYLIRGMEDFCSRAERRTDG